MRGSARLGGEAPLRGQYCGFVLRPLLGGVDRPCELAGIGEETVVPRRLLEEQRVSRTMGIFEGPGRASEPSRAPRNVSRPTAKEKPGDGIKAQRRGGILLKEQVPRTVEAEDQPPRPRRLREADIARRTGDRPRKDKFASRALDGGRAQGAFCSPQEQAVLYAIPVDVHLRADNGAGQTAFKGELPGCCPAAGKGDPNTDG